MTQLTLVFDYRTSPFSDLGRTGSLTADPETLLHFLCPYIEAQLKQDTIRSITLWEGERATRLAEFPDEMAGLKRRLRDLAAEGRAESLV